MKAVRAKKWLFNKVLDWSYNNRNHMPFKKTTRFSHSLDLPDDT